MSNINLIVDNIKLREGYYEITSTLTLEEKDVKLKEVEKKLMKECKVRHNNATLFADMCA